MRLDKYELQLTDRIKEIITNMGLIKTGNLLRNTFVKLDFNRELTIEIDSVNYYEFVDDKNKITETFLNDQKVIEIIEDLTIYIIEDNIK